MARTTQPAKDPHQQPPEEHRIETPRGDLVILKMGPHSPKPPMRPEESAAVLLPKLLKAIAKPGLTRAQIFGKTSRKVYAYSVYPKDLSKLVREDAAGHKVVGTFSNGRFRPLRTGRSL
jgi:hypothetical protein